jgi:hypothetical protein
MRLRPLALFALTAGLAVLVGDFSPVDAQIPKQGKKNRKKGVPPVEETRPVETARSEPTQPKEAKKASLETPSTRNAAAIARLIDQEVNRKLAEAKLKPSPLCSDVEFLRRAYLDLTGVIPPADRARAFIDSPEPDKRAKLVRELLADPNYGRRMADIWTAKLFSKDSNNRFVLREPLYKWLEQEFNKNVPWNKMVTELVTASGTVQENPAVTYFLANRSVDKLTDTCTQHFLGLQLQCAQCHNHPFTTWKQTEYWGMATFFARVKIDNPKNANKGADNSTLAVHEGPGRVKTKDFFPESAKTVPAKFLGGAEPNLGASDAARPVLARWMTSPDNPYFSRAMVNRTWAHLLGRGFVNPIDDMLPENEPSHPELLDALAEHMGKTGFDIKYLMEAICLSETYQRTSKPTAENKVDATLFSHMAVKVMSPEQLYDSLGMVTGRSIAEPAGKVKGGNKGQPAGPRAQFVSFFLAGSEAASTTEYEVGIPQALRLMNSPITNNPAIVRRVIGTAREPQEAIERIYLAALSRRPTEEELKTLKEYVAHGGDRLAAYEDILWAVLNSSEFTLVR